MKQRMKVSHDALPRHTFHVFILGIPRDALFLTPFNASFMTLRFFIAALLLTNLGGCASFPPGANYPRTKSTALADPGTTRLGSQFDRAAKAHDGNSGFHIIPAGMDGFLMRMQMINTAQKTLDMQYFIFRGDHTGRMLTDAVLRAADRGVRVRILLDDAATKEGDEQITRLESHPLIEIRIFNPFAYRGHSPVLKAAEFMFHASRLDYRMHNKLLIADNAIALMGGRNIGDQYFQIDPSSQFADDDVFAAGPVVRKLSESFDEFWNYKLAIPAAALQEENSTQASSERPRVQADAGSQIDDADYRQRTASGEPLAGILAGSLPLVWAHATLVYDSPDKKNVENGRTAGRLLNGAVAGAALEVKHELLVITPYLIPGKEGMKLIWTLRQRKVRVRILTSSLESSTVLLAQAGYMHYRIPLLEEGVELYEIRSLLGDTRGSGETAAISRYGNYSLHAKLFVFDRKRVFIGSMNFDQRSMHLNTEIGLIIDSPVLSEQIAERFDAMTRPVNAYHLVLNERDGEKSLAWRTRENEKEIEYSTEPAKSSWQRVKADTLSWLPVDDEL